MNVVADALHANPESLDQSLDLDIDGSKLSLWFVVESADRRSVNEKASDGRSGVRGVPAARG